MTSKLSIVLNACTPQRIVAGLVFLPLLAYTFPPFLADDLSFMLRLLFWAGVMSLALCATWLARQVVRKNPALLNLKARDFVVAGIILTIFTPALWLLAWILFTFGGHMVPGADTVAIYSVLFATGLVLVRRADEFPSEEPPLVPATPRLTRRLPASFSGQIYRLTVRDHNVDVVTSEGTFTIRSRFTDAINEMEPVPGHCAHRSHWVADAAIVGLEKTGGKTSLRLTNGDLVPVSRKYKPKLEADGLI